MTGEGPDQAMLRTLFTPIRIFLLAVLAAFMLALWYWGPRLEQSGTVSDTPQARACLAAAAAKYPAKMVEMSKTPDGTSHVLVNTNADAYQAEFRACMDGQSKP